MKTITLFSKKSRACILFFYFLLTTATPGFTIEIACLSGGNECFTGAEPEVISISYGIKASRSNDLIVGSSIKWNVRGGKVEGQSSGNEIVTIRWDNTPNNSGSGHDISVSATVISGSEGSVESHSKPVTVKYIGPISTLHIDGSSVNNNSNTIVNCGRRNVDLVANLVTTDPYTAVRYTWSFPAGWTGSSSTFNPEALPYSNAGGGGYIKLTAQRADGLTKQTYKVYINRPKVGVPQVSESTPITLCNGQTQTISVNTPNNPTSFKWSPSGHVSSVGASNNQTYRFRNSSQGRLTITVDNACKVPKSKSFDVFSTPVLSSATVNGRSAQYLNLINNPALLKVTTLNSASSYSWQITNGSGSIYPNHSQCRAYAYPFTIVKAVGNNECGSANLYFFYLQKNGGYYKMRSPNPVSDRIKIEFLEPEYMQDHL